MSDARSANTIEHIAALKRLNQADAQQTLDKVHRYVMPLMRQRGWRVGKLSEFFPKDKRLLGININRGAHIRLRLRSPFDSEQFLPFEDVLGTMLHELCHIRYGPHDRVFFKLLDELKSELETLMMRGFRGDLFLGHGHRLGTGNQVRGSAPALRGLATTRIGRGHKRGRKLGGIRKPGDLRELTLEAAERRRAADRGCRALEGIDDSCDIGEISREDWYRSRSPLPSNVPPRPSNVPPRPSNALQMRFSDTPKPMNPAAQSAGGADPTPIVIDLLD